MRHRMNSQTPQTLERGLQILVCLADAEAPLTVTDVAARVLMPKSSVYRFLLALRAYGLAEETERGRYHLGTRALALGQAARKHLNLPRLCRPLMQDLAHATGESVILTVIRWPYGVCIERVESAHPVRLTMEPGTVTALHAGASCKVLLAFADPGLRERYLRETPLHRYTEGTTIDPEVLRRQLREIRAHGYAITADEVDVGSSGVAVPILGIDDDLVAGLSIAGPTVRLDAAMIDRCREALVRASREVTEMMAGRGAGGAQTARAVSPESAY
jgi:DNA-binding IclR family transcriptional regulator